MRRLTLQFLGRQGGWGAKRAHEAVASGRERLHECKIVTCAMHSRRSCGCVKADDQLHLHPKLSGDVFDECLGAVSLLLERLTGVTVYQPPHHPRRFSLLLCLDAQKLLFRKKKTLSGHEIYRYTRRASSPFRNMKSCKLNFITRADVEWAAHTGEGLR